MTLPKNPYSWLSGCSAKQWYGLGPLNDPQNNPWGCEDLNMYTFWQFVMCFGTCLLHTHKVGIDIVTTVLSHIPGNHLETFEPLLWSVWIWTIDGTNIMQTYANSFLPIVRTLHDPACTKGVITDTIFIYIHTICLTHRHTISLNHDSQGAKSQELQRR